MSDKNSQHSIYEATRTRSKFSGHGKAKGAAGYNRKRELRSKSGFVLKSGESHKIKPIEDGFSDIKIACSWNPVQIKNPSFLGKFVKPVIQQEVDLDLGCLYELRDGTRGAIQAFGNLHGSHKNPPYIHLSEDERTGEKEGYDEMLVINGQNWPMINRILVYTYIYEGVADWQQVAPEIHLSMFQFDPITLTLTMHEKHLNLCVIATMENWHNGISITNRTEYYPGHNEMDRAYGFGLNWGDGRKSD